MLESIGAVLPQAAATFGDKTALVVAGREFSFRELDDISTRLAAGLSELGIGHGDRERGRVAELVGQRLPAVVRTIEKRRACAARC